LNTLSLHDALPIFSDLSFAPANAIKNYIKGWMKMEDFDLWCLDGSIRHENLQFPEIMIECGRRKRRNTKSSRPIEGEQLVLELREFEESNGEREGTRQQHEKKNGEREQK
jgi:hypothetical protein